MIRAGVAVAVAVACLGAAGQVLADPCTASVSGYRPGQTFSGVVRYVGDGDSLCVGSLASPSTWVEVRLADFYAPELHAPGGREAKATLERLAMGRPAVCEAQQGRNGRTSSHDRVIAVCRIAGRSLGMLMSRAGMSEGGNGR